MVMFCFSRCLVSQVGYCIKCPTDVFSHEDAQRNNRKDHQKFYDDCLVDAFDATTLQLKSNYECDIDSRDYRLFQALLAGW